MSTNKDTETLKTECKLPDALLSYLEAKAKNHTHFKMYSTLSSLKYKMEEESLFLSTGTNWNDIPDKEAFNPEGADYVRFGACFSFSHSESVAMWMLYGGLHKDGVMVDFKKDNIIACMNTERVILGIWDNQKFFPVTELDKSKCRFQLIDILYTGDSKKFSDCYYIKRSSETHHVEKSLIDSVNCFKKNLPWNYENECRLVLTVDSNYITDSSINSAQIRLPKAYDRLLSEKRIFMAPNFDPKLDADGFRPSTLSDNIDWNLCHNCKGKTTDNGTDPS